MILFKRVSDSFRHIEGREWALLCLETLGVLAGILIAFELNEWASERADASRQRKQLERLLTEAEDNVATLRSQREWLGQMVDDERAFAITLVHEGKCPPKPQWAAIGTTNRYPPFDVAEAVYQEMMGAGGLSTIENPYVRRRISDFHAELESYDNANNYFRLKATEPVADNDARHSIDFDPNAEDSTTDWYDRAALCADRAFRNRVASAVRNHQVLAGKARSELTDYAIEMCAAIGQALGKSCVPRWGGPLKGADVKVAAKALREMKAAAAA
jgi:hypothetical protein